MKNIHNTTTLSIDQRVVAFYVSDNLFYIAKMQFNNKCKLIFYSTKGIFVVILGAKIMSKSILCALGHDWRWQGKETCMVD
jgi:hypothetical protein